MKTITNKEINENSGKRAVYVDKQNLPNFFSALDKHQSHLVISLDAGQEVELESYLSSYIKKSPESIFVKNENHSHKGEDALVTFSIDNTNLEKNDKCSDQNSQLFFDGLIRIHSIEFYENGKSLIVGYRDPNNKLVLVKGPSKVKKSIKQIESLVETKSEIPNKQKQDGPILGLQEEVDEHKDQKDCSTSIEIIPSDSETALLNNEISTSYTPPRDMNRLVRWMKQNSLSEKLFLYPHVKWGIGDKENFSSRQYIFHYPSCPLAKEKNIRAIAFTHYFFNGLKLMLDRAWPAAFYGMFLNDVIHYTISSAATRYGVSASDIVLGHAKTAQVWTSSWGSDYLMDFYPNEWASPLISHFSAPAAITGTVLLASSYRMLAGAKAVLSDSSHQEPRPLPKANFILDTFRWLNPLPCGLSSQLEQAIFNLQHQQIDDDWEKTFNQIKHIIEHHHSLLRLSAIDGIAKVTNTATLMRKNDPLMLSSELQAFYADLEERCYSLLKEMAHHSLYAKYTLWSHGYDDRDDVNLGWQSLFWLQSLTMILLVWISKLKLAEMVALKIYDYKADLDKEKACHQESKQWFYIKEWAEQICTLCGDWPFVGLNDQFTAQGCFKALIETQAPHVILSHMERFFNQTTIEEVEELNLSNQHLNTWTVKEWNAFLNKTLESGTGIKKINLSNGKAETFSLNDDKLIALAEFINQGEVEELDLSEQNLTAESFKALTEKLEEVSHLEKFDLTNNQLKNQGAIYLANWIAQTKMNLTMLQVGNNQISDEGMEKIFSSLRYQPAVTAIDISGNPIGQKSIDALVKYADTFLLEQINFSAINLSSLNLTAWWQCLFKKPLKNLELMQTQFSDQQCEELNDLLPNMQVEQIKFFKNKFNDDNLINLIMGLKENVAIEMISFIETRFYSHHFSLLGKNLPTQVEELVLNDCNLNASAFSDFIDALLHKKRDLKILSLANNEAGDGLVQGLVTAFNHGMHIESLDLSGNRLTDAGISSLIQAIKDNNVKIKKIILAHNQLTDKSANKLADLVRLQSIEHLDISHNLIGAEGSKKLGTALSQSAIKHLDISHNPAGRGVKPLLEKLITPFPDMQNDGELHISIDERRALREAKSNTTLAYLDVTDTNMDSSTTTLACRMQPQVNTTLRFSSMYTCRDRLKNEKTSENESKKNRSRRQLKIENGENPASYLFSSHPSSSINPFPNGIIAPDAHTNPSSSSLSMGALFILGCTNPIVTLVLMYVLYRAVSPSVQKVASNMAGFFKKTNEDEKKLPDLEAQSKKYITH